MQSSENPALICIIAMVVPLVLCLGLGALAGWLANKHGKMWEQKLAKEKQQEGETDDALEP